MLCTQPIELRLLTYCSMFNLYFKLYAINDIQDVFWFEQGLFWYQIHNTLLNSNSSISQYSVHLFKRIARFTDKNCVMLQGLRLSLRKSIVLNLKIFAILDTFPLKVENMGKFFHNFFRWPGKNKFFGRIFTYVN